MLFRKTGILRLSAQLQLVLFWEIGARYFNLIPSAFSFFIPVVLLFFFFNFINSFIYFWLRWVFVAVRGLSLVVASGDYSSLRCVDFSLWWLLLLGARALGTQASVVARGLSSSGSWALERRLSSCGAWA